MRYLALILNNTSDKLQGQMNYNYVTFVTKRHRHLINKIQQTENIIQDTPFYINISVL